jgi:DNA-binding protein H-NS
VSKVAAKYRDPASGKTWSGRGLKPRWLSEAIAAGKQLTDFSI